MAIASDLEVLWGQPTFKVYACVLIKPQLSPCKLTVPAKLQDVRPSPSFTKSSIVQASYLHLPSRHAHHADHFQTRIGPVDLAILTIEGQCVDGRHVVGDDELPTAVEPSRVDDVTSLVCPKQESGGAGEGSRGGGRGGQGRKREERRQTETGVTK